MGYKEGFDPGLLPHILSGLVVISLAGQKKRELEQNHHNLRRLVYNG
jgi:radical SAM superfamily enzyme with C-terminal helix-hairpin-helix motif